MAASFPHLNMKPPWEALTSIPPGTMIFEAREVSKMQSLLDSVTICAKRMREKATWRIMTA